MGLLDYMRRNRPGEETSGQRRTATNLRFRDQYTPETLYAAPSLGASDLYDKKAGTGQAGVGKTKALFAAASGRALPELSRSYMDRPPTFDEFTQTLGDTIGAFAQAADNPWDAQAIMDDIRATSSSPEVAAKFQNPEVLHYIRQNPEIVDQYMAGSWTNFLGTITEAIPEKAVWGDIRLTPAENNKFVAQFMKRYDTKFSEEERKFILGVLSAIPTGQDLLAAKGFKPSTKGGLLGDWENGIKVWFGGHAGAVRPLMQNPRAAIAAQAHLYLQDNDVSSQAGKAQFFSWLATQSSNQIEELSRTQEGFGAFGAAVETPFVTFAEKANDAIQITNDWIHMSTTPEQFAVRRHLTIGQNAALGLGYKPGDYQWEMVSGTFDGIVSVFADPLNVIAGAGSGIKNASKIPRLANVSKSRALAQALNPWRGARNLRLVGFDKSTTTRMTYSLFSKTADEIVDTKAAHRTWGRIAKLSDAEIRVQYPDLKNNQTIGALGRASTPEAVRDIVLAGMKGMLPEEAAKTGGYWAKQIASQNRHITNYITGRRAVVAQNGLDALRGGPDVINQLDVYEVAVPRGAAGPLTDVDIRGKYLNNNGTLTADEAHEYVQFRWGDSVDPDEVEIIEGMRARIREVGPEQFMEEAKFAPDGSPTPMQFTVMPDDGRVMISDGNHRIAALRAEGHGDFIIDEIIPFQPGDAAEARLFRQMVDEEEATRGDVVNRAYDVGGAMLRRSTLTGDTETRKVVISQLGTGGGLKRASLEWGSVRRDAAEWLIETRTAEGDALATKLMAGMDDFSELSPAEVSWLRKYADAEGLDFLDAGDLTVTSRRGEKYLVEGVDNWGTDVGTMDEFLPEQMSSLHQALADQAYMHANVQPFQWFVMDLPQTSAWKLVKRAARHNNVNGRWSRGFRRLGAALSMKMPQNISMTDSGAGADALRNWIKTLGGREELATKWVNEFLAGNPGNRQQIILQAFVELGEELENPLLGQNLIEFVQKQGNNVYAFDSSARELGEAADGSIFPSMPSHFAAEFSMPDGQEMIRMVRRMETANNQPKVLTEGIFRGTRRKRQDIADTIKARLGERAKDFDQEDLIRMAYADIVGGEFGRATGAGILSKAGVFTIDKVFKPMTRIFAIAQLAGRPIAWMSRVLLEETFRAELMGMPSVWVNPYNYISEAQEAGAIRKMPEMIRKQSAVTNDLVDELFRSPNYVERASEFLPELVDDLRVARIDPLDFEKVKAYVQHRLGAALLGGDPATLAEIGKSRNVTRRALLRGRKLERTLEKMDEAGLLKSFRWDIDGEGIANRSFYQNFISESESAALPAEYALGQMNTRSLEVYGRGYGRQIHQVLHDPIVGQFGTQRALARLAGRDVVAGYDEAALVQTRAWQHYKHVVYRKGRIDGVEFGNELDAARYYLEQTVDPYFETLIRPLAQDRGDYARILGELEMTNNNQMTVILPNGKQRVINFSRSNYEGAVRQVEALTKDAYYQDVQLPPKVAAWFHPRYGEVDSPNRFRRATDWIMMNFGEKSTQHINRQPAYLATHRKYYQWYKGMGWDDDAARSAATQRATEMVNWVFFDNKDIPRFLHNMNDVSPFFSAMIEVAGTWAYKIPSQNMLPIGYAHLVRRVDRTIQGLVKSGIVDYDADTGQYSMSLSAEPDAIPGAAGLSRALYETIKAPIYAVEHLGGIVGAARELFDGDDEAITWDRAKMDLSNFYRDGFRFGVGNPLDPTTFGIMAVNQFSVGLAPALQLPASMAAEAIFAADDDYAQLGFNNMAELIVGHDLPDGIEPNDIVIANRAAIQNVNSAEKWAMYLQGKLDPAELQLPETLRIPHTSMWETMANNTFFPFGKLESIGEVITSPSPAAMNYVWRGLMARYGGDVGQNDMTAFFFGNMSNYQVASEMTLQMQMLEAKEGLISASLEKSLELQQHIADTNLDVRENPDGTIFLLSEDDGPEANKFHDLKLDLAAINEEILSRASSNAGGSLILRGLMGQYLPATPRMVTQQQDEVAKYWNARDFAERAAEGTGDFTEILHDISTPEGMRNTAELVQRFWDDPTGDKAKIFMANEMPGLRPFMQGKTYFEEYGLDPRAEGFDRWVEQIESGERKAFPPEVWLARYQKASIAVDKDIAVREAYGDDVNGAAIAILNDYGSYRDLIEPFEMQYEAVDFIDEHLFEGKYGTYRNDNFDELSFYEEVIGAVRQTREEVDNIIDILEFTDLTPAEVSKVRGTLRSTVRNYQEKVEELRALEDENDYWRNPLEQMINRYYTEVSTPYYEARNELYDDLQYVENTIDRGLVFDAIRDFDNDAFIKDYVIEGERGAVLRVPEPMVRTWNSYTDEERQERKIKMLGKKPEWLSLFEANVLADGGDPDLHNYLVTDEDRAADYFKLAQAKRDIAEFAFRNPEEMSEYDRDKAIRELQEEFDNFLLSNGRGAEIEFREAVPIQRLAMAGYLPPSLDEVVPWVNSIIEQLRADEESIRGKQARIEFLGLQRYLESQYFRGNPQALVDLEELGIRMFDEPLRAAIYARLFQGDFFGYLE